MYKLSTIFLSVLLLLSASICAETFCIKKYPSVFQGELTGELIISNTDNYNPISYNIVYYMGKVIIAKRSSYSSYGYGGVRELTSSDWKLVEKLIKAYKKGNRCIEYK